MAVRGWTFVRLLDLLQFARVKGKGVGNIPTRPESIEIKAIEKWGLLFNSVIMKFEKISDDKFKMFALTALKNLNAIVGGGIDTDRPGTGTHDIAYTGGGGQNLDTIRKTNDGFTDDSAGDLVN